MNHLKQLKSEEKIIEENTVMSPTSVNSKTEENDFRIDRIHQKKKQHIKNFNVFNQLTLNDEENRKIKST